MNKDKKVSVIMSTFNEREEWLIESIESILNQTYKNIEFIIIIDNPQNHMLADIIYRYAKKDSRIIVIKNKVNLGLIRSLNIGIYRSEGELIARMDADDISENDRIEKQVKYMLHNQVDIIGGSVRVIEESGNIIKSYMRMPVGIDKINKKIKFTNPIVHPTYMVRKSVYHSLNGYRDIPTCEDYDFIIRAASQGYKIDNLDDVVLSYRMSKNSISRSSGLDQYLTMRYLQKNIHEIDKLKYIKTETKNHENNCDKYSKSNSYFINGISDLENKKLISGFYYIIKSLINSRYYLGKVITMIRGILI